MFLKRKTLLRYQSACFAKNIEAKTQCFLSLNTFYLFHLSYRK